MNQSLKPVQFLCQQGLDSHFHGQDRRGAAVAGADQLDVDIPTSNIDELDITPIGLKGGANHVIEHRLHRIGCEATTGSLCGSGGFDGDPRVGWGVGSSVCEPHCHQPTIGSTSHISAKFQGLRAAKHGCSIGIREHGAVLGLDEQPIRA